MEKFFVSSGVSLHFSLRILSSFCIMSSFSLFPATQPHYNKKQTYIPLLLTLVLLQGMEAFSGIKICPSLKTTGPFHPSFSCEHMAEMNFSHQKIQCKNFALFWWFIQLNRTAPRHHTHMLNLSRCHRIRFGPKIGNSQPSWFEAFCEVWDFNFCAEAVPATAFLPNSFI